MVIDILNWLIANWPWVAVGWIYCGVIVIFWPNTPVARSYLEECPQLWLALPLAIVGWPIFLIAAFIGLKIAGTHDPYPPSSGRT